VSPDKAPKVSPIWNVPHARNPNFTGRAWNLTTLHEVLGSGRPGATVQALSGLGGVGKTQLALEYAYRYAGDYDVVWWLRAEEPATLASDFATLAAHLAGAQWMTFPREHDQRAIIAAVKHWLEHNERWLLVFDSAREPGVVVPYLPGAGTGHVLITTRNASFRGVATLMPIRELERVDSIAFLLARTGQGDRKSAQKLCDALGDLPLALSQAGAYIEESGTTFSAYLETFERKRRELLRRGATAQALPTVATTWNIAFDEVQERSPAGAELLRLSAFLAADDIPRDDLSEGLGDGPFPLPPALAAAVLDPLALDDAIAALRRYSLIEVEGESLSVHRLVQLVVRDRLSEEERATWAGRAACLVHAGYATEREDTSATNLSAARWLPHVRTVCEHAEAAGVAREVTVDLLIRAAKNARERTPIVLTESIKLYGKALAIAAKVKGPSDPMLARILTGLSLSLERNDDLVEARRAAERALAIDLGAGEPDGPSVTRDLTNLARVVRGLGMQEEQKDRRNALLNEARGHVEQALRIDERLNGSRHVELIPRLNELSVIVRDLGDLEAAERHLERALSIGESAIGESATEVEEELAALRSNLASVLSERAEKEREEGHEARARHLLEKAKEYLLRTVASGVETHGEEHYVVAVRRNNLGLALRDLGDLAGAHEQISRALTIMRKVLRPDHRRVLKLERNLEAVEREMRRVSPTPKSNPGLKGPGSSR
jgi:tetratricopeptide (TPR) repeat protein